MWRASPSRPAPERLLAVIGVLLAGFFLAGAAFAGGSVKGTLEAPDPSLANQKRLRDTVVRLRPESEAAVAAGEPSDSIVEIRHGAFSPRVVAVAVGATVEFVNRDEHIHNVASTSPAKKFDLGMTAAGESGRVTFDREGVVRFVCKAESPMDGYVVVSGNRWFAVPNEEGGYEIQDVPVGSWIAEAWSPHFEPVRSPVYVRREGEVVRADFHFTGRR